MSQGELEVIAALQQLVITLRRHYIARAMLQLSASLLFAGGMVSIFSNTDIQTWWQTLSN